MNLKILSAVDEYREIKAKKAELPTVDQIAEKYGMTRTGLLRYAAILDKKTTPAISQAQGAV